MATSGFHDGFLHIQTETNVRLGKSVFPRFGHRPFLDFGCRLRFAIFSMADDGYPYHASYFYFPEVGLRWLQLASAFGLVDRSNASKGERMAMTRDITAHVLNMF